VLALILSTTLLFGDLQSPRAISWYGTLLKEGGYGRLSRERAAFLIRESDGSLTLAPWSENGDLHATFRGPIPDGAIAIVHTHPREEPSPSRHDRHEAKSLRMPVLVITPDGVVAAFPDSDVRIAQRGWSDRPTSSGR
jgi:hypothetical protein